jgi:hypothetical protein
MKSRARRADNAGMNASPRKRNPFVRIVLSVLWLAGAFLVWREFEPLIVFRPVQAEVLSADIVLRTVTDARRGVSRGPRTHSGYVPDITYRYTVNDVEYVSAQFSRTGTLESGYKARRRMRSIIHDGRVTAYYSPFNPEDAVLGRAPNFILITILMFAWFMGWLFTWAATRPSPGAALILQSKDQAA